MPIEFLAGDLFANRFGAAALPGMRWARDP
jgi:hypothetical protein